MIVRTLAIQALIAADGNHFKTQRLLIHAPHAGAGLARVEQFGRLRFYHLLLLLLFGGGVSCGSGADEGRALLARPLAFLVLPSLVLIILFFELPARIANISRVLHMLRRGVGVCSDCTVHRIVSYNKLINYFQFF